MPTSYTAARSTLYQLLSGWTFCTVVRDPVVPDTGVNEHGHVTYYHFTCKPLPMKRAKTSAARVWCKRNSIAKLPLEAGPITVPRPNPDAMPAARDVVMGKIVVKTNNIEHRKVGQLQTPSLALCTDAVKRYELVSWYPNSGALYKLYQLVVEGTSKRENAYAHVFRLYNEAGTPVDDVWAMVRLVLYGNLQLFVDLSRDAIVPCGYGRNMLLSCTAETFVYRCSVLLFDASIWDDFVVLAPDWRERAPELAHQLRQSRTKPVSKSVSRPVSRPVSNSVSTAKETSATSSDSNDNHARASNVMNQVMSFIQSSNTSIGTSTNASADTSTTPSTNSNANNSFTNQSYTPLQFSAYKPFTPYSGYDALRQHNDMQTEHDGSVSPPYTPNTPPSQEINYHYDAKFDAEYNSEYAPVSP